MSLLIQRIGKGPHYFLGPYFLVLTRVVMMSKGDIMTEPDGHMGWVRLYESCRCTVVREVNGRKWEASQSLSVASSGPVSWSAGNGAVWCDDHIHDFTGIWTLDTRFRNKCPAGGSSRPPGPGPTRLSAMM